MACGPGTFQPVSGTNATACRPCPRGSFTPLAGATDCSACPPGLSSNEPGAADCESLWLPAASLLVFGFDRCVRPWCVVCVCVCVCVYVCVCARFYRIEQWRVTSEIALPTAADHHDGTSAHTPPTDTPTTNAPYRTYGTAPRVYLRDVLLVLPDWELQVGAAAVGGCGFGALRPDDVMAWGRGGRGGGGYWKGYPDYPPTPLYKAAQAARLCDHGRNRLPQVLTALAIELSAALSSATNSNSSSPGTGGATVVPASPAALVTSAAVAAAVEAVAGSYAEQLSSSGGGSSSGDAAVRALAELLLSSEVSAHVLSDYRLGISDRLRCLPGLSRLRSCLIRTGPRSSCACMFSL